MKWLIAGCVVFFAGLGYLAYKDYVWWSAYRVEHKCAATGRENVTYIPVTSCTNNSCVTTITPIFSYEFKCDDGYLWR